MPVIEPQQWPSGADSPPFVLGIVTRELTARGTRRGHMLLNGYGKILDVNLTTGDLVRTELGELFARRFLGGMGFGAKLLYDEVGVDVDPLGPENVIIIANGPLTGTRTPCAGRTEITTKSPLTGHLGTGNTGGLWGARLKHAGLDLVLIRGEAERPVYLWISDDRAELRDAGHLWGLATTPTTRLLSEELGGQADVSVLAIGPAGEHKVRFACPVNDHHHCAARGGAGAVMGAKRLKAIAVRGTGRVRIARPEEFREASRQARERLMIADRSTSLTSGVVRDIREVLLERESLPGKNFQVGTLPRWVETRGAAAAEKYVVKHEGTCYGCPTSCFKLVEVREGKYSGVRVSRGTAPGVVFEWGAKLAIDNLPAIWKCKEMCQELGMDYASAAGTIAFAVELFQRGVLTARDTDGLDLTWGGEDAIITLLNRISARKGLGDLLAEGSEAAARAIGRGAGRYAMTIKGMEMMSDRDPRSGSRGWVFGELTNPRGGDNVKGTHFRADRHNRGWSTDQIDMFEEVKERIYSVPVQELEATWEGKPLMCRWFEDLTSVCNALGVCFFPASFNLALGPTHFARMFSACTGWDTSPSDIMTSGARIFTVLKAYGARQGLGRENDLWPERFFCEPQGGSSRNAPLSKSAIGKLLDEYYELRGWDVRTGLPTEGTLTELGLEDVAEDLSRWGKLPVGRSRAPS
ncbi:MAG: aldehyde ferredoxin oxidoreductase family protein [Deltaproteobacteria bacterium]|nr:aldehyde ferredoxin oxidoreductase family protein [Deltaproteobacteria bacterium]